MTRYDKPWLSLEDQAERLASRGIAFSDTDSCIRVLRSVGYYRLSGYLYPFRLSEQIIEDGRLRQRILSEYTPGTTLDQAVALIDFDRHLRLLVLEGIERIEVSLRMQLGYAIGKRSPFAHLDEATFVRSFTEEHPGATGPLTSKHAMWLERVRERQADSDEAFVQHFRDAYDGEMPIWALTEILEIGHLNRLFSGLERSIATEIAGEYRVPTKKMLTSWLASLNHVRNLSAHHARLFNRKLVTAPARPGHSQVPLLGHLKEETSAKEVLGVYNVLAIMAYLLTTFEPQSGWSHRMKTLLLEIPVSDRVDERAMGAPKGWAHEELWRD